MGIGPGDDFGPFYRGKGCPYCDFTGFYGRAGIFELFMLDDEIGTLINSGVPESSIRERAQAKGMQCLRKDGLRRIKEGNTTPREVLKVTSM